MSNAFVFRTRLFVTLTSEPNRRVYAIYCGGVDLVRFPRLAEAAKSDVR